MTRTSVKGNCWVYIVRLLDIGSRLARCMTRLDGSNLIQLTYGRHSGWLHHYPACGGYGLRKARPVFRAALNANRPFGSLTWIHGADRAPGKA